MPLAIPALLRLILEGVVEWLKLQVLEAQLRLKMLLIEQKEKYENEADSKQKQIDDLRAAGRNDAADVVYNQLLRRTDFLVDLSNGISGAAQRSAGSNEEGNLHPPIG